MYANGKDVFKASIDTEIRHSLCVNVTSGIPGIAMEHYKALYSAVAPYHGSLATYVTAISM
jgi:hypothetical protein